MVNLFIEPQVDDRRLDQEAQKVEDKLNEVEDIAPNVDTRGMERDIDRMEGPDLGGGGGMPTPVPMGGFRGGGGSLLSKGGAAASAAIPVALAGAGLFSLKKVEESLAKASPALQTMHTQFAAAITNLRAPFGRALAGQLEPSATSLLEASVEFRRAAEEQGFGAAFQQLGEDILMPNVGELLEGPGFLAPIEDQIGDTFDDIRAGGEIGAVTGGIFGGQLGAQVGGAIGGVMAAAVSPLMRPLQTIVNLLPNLPSIPDFTVDNPNSVTFVGGVPVDLVEPTVNWSGATPAWGDIFTEPEWKSLMDFPGVSTWLQIIPPPPWSDVIGGFRATVESALGGFSWDLFVDPFDWGTFVDPLNWNNFIDELTGGGGGGGSGGGAGNFDPNLSGPGADPPSGNWDFVPGQGWQLDIPGFSSPSGDAGGVDLPGPIGLQSGGRITQTGTARVHRGELVASPDRLVSDLAAAISQAGGGGDSSRVVQELQRLRDELSGGGDERVVRELRRTRQAIQALRDDLDGPTDVGRFLR